jgi:hypothetical protein
MTNFEAGKDNDERYLLGMAFTTELYMYGSADNLIPHSMARRLVTKTNTTGRF